MKAKLKFPDGSLAILHDDNRWTCESNRDLQDLLNDQCTASGPQYGYFPWLWNIRLATDRFGGQVLWQAEVPPVPETLPGVAF
jgi:hypothetical protein